MFTKVAQLIVVAVCLFLHILFYGIIASLISTALIGIAAVLLLANFPEWGQKILTWLNSAFERAATLRDEIR